VKERAELEIRFPRVAGYRTELPEQVWEADFNEDSRYQIDPMRVGPTSTLMAGVVGQQENITVDEAVYQMTRPSALNYHLAFHLLSTRYRDPDTGRENMNLFLPLRRIVRQWLDGGYLVCKGGAKPGMLAAKQLADEACERIFLAIERARQRRAGEDGEKTIRIIPDPYNPEGSSRHVQFITSKPVFETDPAKCHVSHVVEDSTWEAELARVVEAHPKVLAYVKNQGLGLEVPYKRAAATHRYIPDFIVRLDTGADEPLNLILEVKGFRDQDAALKAETIKTLWVPGVNTLATHGRWAFEELRDVWDIEEAFGEIVMKYSRETS